MKQDKRPVAILTIHGAGKMTLKRRWQISEWLEKAAQDILLEGQNYSKRYTARLWK